MTTARKIGPNRRDTLGGINSSQKGRLLEEMLKNPMLALKQYSAVERCEMWQGLATKLNYHGPEKTSQQWEMCWNNLMARARANPESDTYKPIMDVIRQCEASLANHNAETVCLDGCSSGSSGRSLRNRSNRISRRQSTAANDDSIVKVLRQLAESDQKRLDLEQHMIRLHGDVLVVMNQLTEIVGKVSSGRRVSFHEDA